jgi:hypothetical protein
MRARVELTMCKMSQVEAEGEVATAFTLARMLSNIPFTRGGPASIVIFDIHALQVCVPQHLTVPPLGMTLEGFEMCLASALHSDCSALASSVIDIS